MHCEGRQNKLPGWLKHAVADQTIKILLNSIISTLEARFMTIDINIFYLNTPLKIYKYVHLKIEDILEMFKLSTNYMRK